MMVSQLIDQELHSWRSNLVQEVFDADSSKAILAIHIPVRPKADKLIWVHNPKGNFSVKSTFCIETEQTYSPSSSTMSWNKLWKIQAPERIKMLLWRIGANSLPTKENIQKRVATHDPLCALCQQDTESPIHLFMKCPIARALWHSCCWGFRPEDHLITTSEDIIKVTIHPPDSPCPPEDRWLVTLNMALILEEIWKFRKQVVHQNGQGQSHLAP